MDENVEFFFKAADARIEQSYLFWTPSFYNSKLIRPIRSLTEGVVGPQRVRQKIEVGQCLLARAATQISGHLQTVLRSGQHTVCFLIQTVTPSRHVQSLSWE